MNAHYFEHPLNEKTRIYLRVEALLTQLDTAAHFDDDMKYLIFYRSLFDLVEIFEQIQLKSELAKDIEKQRLTYRSWLDFDGVYQDMLNEVLDEIDMAHSDLMTAERFGQSLKDDRFLSTIRQRFNLPGGCCCFDLPALHHWLHLPLAQKQNDAQNWLTSLQPLVHSLKLWLRLTRETGAFHTVWAKSGFYQSDADEANILRLNLPLDVGVYPMISGHKNRFAIKFIEFESGQASCSEFEFELAICS